MWGRSRSSCVGWPHREGAVSVFIQLAAFPSSDSFSEALLSFLLPTGEKEFVLLGDDNERMRPSHVQGRCEHVLTAANEFALPDWDAPAGVQEWP